MNWEDRAPAMALSMSVGRAEFRVGAAMGQACGYS